MALLVVGISVASGAVALRLRANVDGVSRRHMPSLSGVMPLVINAGSATHRGHPAASAVVLPPNVRWHDVQWAGPNPFHAEWQVLQWVALAGIVAPQYPWSLLWVHGSHCVIVGPLIGSGAPTSLRACE